MTRSSAAGRCCSAPALRRWWASGSQVPLQAPKARPLASAPAETTPGRQGWAAVAVGLVSSFLLPGVAWAVPIQAPSAASAVAPAPGSTPAIGAGPRRPGLIPPASLQAESPLNADPSSGPRRPVPGQTRTLAANP
jgi:hypothetical protein